MGDAFSVPFILSSSSVKIWKIVQVPIAILMTNYVKRQRDLNEEFVSFSCELHLHLSRSQWPLGGRTLQPSPSILFCFQLLLRRRKTSTLSIQRSILFSQHFFCRSLLLLPCTVPYKIVLVSPDDLDTDAQTSTLTCVSLLWLRYHRRAQWLGLFCLWLHR